MAWILIEGLDRSGKSTVCEYYRKKGYDVVHMEAPDKKYSQPGYSGPSYLEEIVDMYNIYSGKDVVFDRTIYGEYIWPEIYNRLPQLNEEDIEYLSRIEYNNNATKILMYDNNVEAHWQRCVDNKEPLNRLQFVQAGRLYDKLAIKHNFKKMQLSEFSVENGLGDETSDSRGGEVDGEATGDNGDNGISDGHVLSERQSPVANVDRGNELEHKLKRANAIRALLKTKIIKKTSEEYIRLEEDIKNYLTDELENIFTPKQERHFTDNEVFLLKMLAKRVDDKSKA